jgi:ferritin-like metal-binding protein YciE
VPSACNVDAGMLPAKLVGHAICRTTVQLLPLKWLIADCGVPTRTVGRTLTITENRMKLETLHDLYVDELKDLYNAEHQLVEALPKMAKAATAPRLAAAFTSHLAETKGHVERLEKIFKKLDASPKGKTCKAMKGLLEEGKELMDENAEPSVMDAALIAAAQRVEHYEMAGYGSVRTFAHLLGEDQAAKLLQETLDEEGAADKKLTKLAETLNAQALHPVEQE